MEVRPCPGDPSMHGARAERPWPLEAQAMGWTEDEVRALAPILERVEAALGQLACARVLVLCSAGGDLALRLVPMLEGKGRVVGLELDPVLLRIASGRAAYSPLAYLLEFKRAERARIPYPDASFDALVSEFIVHPSPAPTEIGQREMARVLRHGGRLVLTDVIAHPMPSPEDRLALRSIGLGYICDASVKDFEAWMSEAGLVDVRVDDVSEKVRPGWEGRRQSDRMSGRTAAYELLLGKGKHSLGKGIRYVLASGSKG